MYLFSSKIVPRDARCEREGEAGVGPQPLSPLSDITAAKPLTGLTSSRQHFFPPSLERLRRRGVLPG